MRTTGKGRSTAILLLLLTLLLPAEASAGRPAWGMRDLSALIGSTRWGLAINHKGEVAGAGEHAFFWSERTGMLDLGVLPGGTYSYAYGINDHRVVVGASSVDPYNVHAFRWTAGGGMEDLGTLGGGSSIAWAVNNRGDIVGESLTASGEVHAFLWTEAEGMVDLGTLGGDSSIAVDVNDRGQVVGTSNLEPRGDGHPFLWTPGTGMMDLGTLGGEDASGNSAHSAEGINDRGDVVGTSLTRSGTHHAFLWTARGGMVDLGTPLGGNSWARAINNRGEVVVKASRLWWSSDHAFVWSARDGWCDLGTLGGDFSSAYDINDRGEVTGVSTTPDVRFHAFLWTRSTRAGDQGGTVAQQIGGPQLRDASCGFLGLPGQTKEIDD